jgi:hypothetical protein
MAAASSPPTPYAMRESSGTLASARVGRRAGQPASTVKNASQAARKRAPSGATSKGTGPLVVTQAQTARPANATAKTAGTVRAGRLRRGSLGGG